MLYPAELRVRRPHHSGESGKSHPPEPASGGILREQSLPGGFVEKRRAPTRQTAREAAIKDFSNAAFSPDIILAMTGALSGAVATLPPPVPNEQIRSLAESILRSAKEGERDPVMLQTLALLELQITAPEGDDRQN
jgi:hypothetical protein